MVLDRVTFDGEKVFVFSMLRSLADHCYDWISACASLVDLRFIVSRRCVWVKRALNKKNRKYL